MFWLLLFFGVASLLWGVYTESPIFLATAGILFIAITFSIWTEGLEIEDGFLVSDVNADATRVPIAYAPLTATPYNSMWVFNMILTGVALACLIYAIGMVAGMWGNRKEKPQGPYS